METEGHVSRCLPSVHFIRCLRWYWYCREAGYLFAFGVCVCVGGGGRGKCAGYTPSKTCVWTLWLSTHVLPFAGHCHFLSFLGTPPPRPKQIGSAGFQVSNFKGWCLFTSSQFLFPFSSCWSGFIAFPRNVALWDAGDAFGWEVCRPPISVHSTHTGLFPLSVSLHTT